MSATTTELSKQILNVVPRKSYFTSIRNADTFYINKSRVEIYPDNIPANGFSPNGENEIVFTIGGNNPVNRFMDLRSHSIQLVFEGISENTTTNAVAAGKCRIAPPITNIIGEQCIEEFALNVSQILTRDCVEYFATEDFELGFKHKALYRTSMYTHNRNNYLQKITSKFPDFTYINQIPLKFKKDTYIG